jgi:hypothetical protein
MHTIWGQVHSRRFRIPISPMEPEPACGLTSPLPHSFVPMSLSLYLSRPGEDDE